MPLGNYYEATKKLELVTNRLEGDLSVDVAIIGGGPAGAAGAPWAQAAHPRIRPPDRAEAREINRMTTLFR